MALSGPRAFGLRNPGPQRLCQRSGHAALLGLSEALKSAQLGHQKGVENALEKHASVEDPLRVAADGLPGRVAAVSRDRASDSGRGGSTLHPLFDRQGSQKTSTS